MHSLVNYWIARQDRYTYYSQAPTASPLSLSWVRAREFDLGAPLNAVYWQWQSGTDAVGQELRIYRRDYARAVLLSRPVVGWPASPDWATPGPLYGLGGTFRLLYPDGTLGPPVTSIALALGEAVALVRVVEDAGVQSDAPPPADGPPPADAAPPDAGVALDGGSDADASSSADTAAAADAAGDGSRSGPLVQGACSCAAGGGAGAPLGLILAAALLWPRRRQRGRSVGFSRP